jgi:hypothetical protein
VARLKYLNRSAIGRLTDAIGSNVDRYLTGDFEEFCTGDYSLALNFECDLSVLARLDPSGIPSAEIANTLAVMHGLGSMPPSTAYEEGIWAHLAHIECLDYSRKRWLAGSSGPALLDAIRKHFFAASLAGRRDDHAISRLWWNGYVANLIDPSDPERVLRQILKTADIRLNFVERSRTSMRLPLASGIVRLMEVDPWVSQRDVHFRSLMIQVNRLGGGRVFEAMSKDAVMSFLNECLGPAKSGAPAIAEPSSVVSPAA